MKSRFWSRLVLTLIVLLVFASTLPTQAQGGDCVAGLKANDCQLLKEMTNGDYRSFLIDEQISLKESGLPGGNIDFLLNGNGGIDVSNVGNVANLHERPFSHIVTNLTFSQSLSWQQNGQPKQNGEFRIVNGVLYLRDNQWPDKTWLKFTLQGDAAVYIMSTLEANITVSDISEAAKIVNQLGHDPDILKAERQDGLLVNDQPTALFTMHINPDALITALADPANRALLKLFLSTRRPSDSSAADDQTVAQAQTALKTLKPALQNAKLTLMERVGTTDKHLQCVCIDFSATVDAASAALVGGTMGQPVTIDVEFMVSLSKIGQPLTVEAVPGAQEFQFPSGC